MRRPAPELGPDETPGPVVPSPVKVVPPPSPGYSFRALQLVWFATGLIVGLILLRFLFKLVGASTASGFVSMIYAITGPLVAPFHGIFPVTAAQTSVLEPASIVAVVVYLLLGWAMAQLVRILTTPRGTRVVD